MALIEENDVASIFLKNVGVDIPIFDVKTASLKKALLGRTIGGRFAKSGAYLTVSALVALLVFGFWCLMSYGGLVRTDFLPTPTAVIQAAVDGLGDGSLIRDTGVSVSRKALRLRDNRSNGCSTV